MSYIISANYRNRNSEYKWLVRREDEDIEKAIELKTVTATGVVFQSSNQRENGYGCGRVARATDVDYWYEGNGGVYEEEERSPEITDEHVNLHFNGYDFVTEAKQFRNVLEELVLLPDGKMKALI
jgi:hypothetical protein